VRRLGAARARADDCVGAAGGLRRAAIAEAAPRLRACRGMHPCRPASPVQVRLDGVKAVAGQHPQLLQALAQEADRQLMELRDGRARAHGLKHAAARVKHDLSEPTTHGQVCRSTRSNKNNTKCWQGVLVGAAPLTQSCQPITADHYRAPFHTNSPPARCAPPSPHTSYTSRCGPVKRPLTGHVRVTSLA
jgi:hypothetical protein